MIARVSFEQFKSFIDWELQSHDLGLRQVPRPFVTISRESGSGAVVVAQKLVEHLSRAGSAEANWTVFDKTIVERVLADHHLPQRIAEYLTEDGTRFIQSTLEELLGLHPPAGTLVEQTTRTILNLATLGHVVIIGRGANVVTARLPQGFHVRLIGSVARRTARLAEVLRLPMAEAAHRLKETDRARHAYVKEHYHADNDDPHSYHMVINTDRVPHEEAAAIIADAMVKRLRAQPPA